MSYQSEAELEKLLIEQLQSQEYARVTVPDYDTLTANFREQFQIFNRENLSTPLSDKEWERVMNYVSGNTVFQCAKILRDKYVLERDDGSKVYTRFIDPDHTKNIWQVTNQTTKVGKYVNRYDVTILVNGLPLVQIELKRRGLDIREAINQINRYKKHSYSGLYHFIQIFVVSNGVDTQYAANTDSELRYAFSFFWTDDLNLRITNLKEFAVAFLARDHINNMINEFTVVNDTEKMIMVMRPYQVYAVKALIRQATLTNQNAYIWHTTGSGKTLTSFKTAQILSQNPNIKKVIFLVDRKDLDSQTTEEFNKFESGSVDVTDRTDVLVEQLKKRNVHLIVTTIQKMANAVKNPRYASVMDQYRDEKVIFIIDECHRSQFGDMHADIVDHFKKAQFFGFTGTPRFEVNGKSVSGKRIITTASLFGKCLHSYLIKDAIFDHNVLGFQVEYIKTIEGDYDVEDPTRASAIDVGELYMADERMTMIANHVLSIHDAKTQNRKYSAIFAVQSIPMLVRYYDIFKSLSHNLRIGAIFTYGANEDGDEGSAEHSRDALERIIADYNNMYNTSFSTDTFNAYHQDISDRLKGKKALPMDILLVVNMFLTGFDSKPLDVLYVDRKLQWHDLLQAYSRTNRVEKETKAWGLIVCYRNLKKATDEAIALFSKTDSTEGILSPDFNYFVDKFNETCAELRKLVPCPSAVDTLYSEEDQKEFVLIFKELAKLMNALKTFVEFRYEKDRLSMTEQEFEDYKSKYFLLYHKVIADKNVVSVLNDVDFCIELMESDKINVAYIMNLIRNIDFSSAAKRHDDIEKIRKELARTTNSELHRKVDILQTFLDMLDSGYADAWEDLDLAYADFEAETKQKEIEAFAAEAEIQPEMLADFIAEYEFTGILNSGEIRDKIDKPLPLLKKKTLVNSIVDFIKAHVLKFQ